MARSKKKFGTSTYDSDEYSTTASRTYSKRVFRKTVRDVVSQTGKTIVADVDQVPHRARRRWKKGIFTSEREMVNHMDVKSKHQELHEFMHAKEESKNNLKTAQQKVKFEAWCESKPAHVVKKTLKKLEREGKETIFDADSTDSEIEKKVEQWVSRNYMQSIGETKRYLETESLQCFSEYRSWKNK
ncbi:hypothetical protein C9374_013347 [Naegleria lovaniensis]|uniref:Uncharacterized protein n=1 Tax=Naegleria lovaniensis TaxID=51637 RepID=A0AA88H249_NAELO|nr:uncharacterized protein C9374_013347 [Naegleria lovaniensis]KAG2391862.1 hypothetical protein C9374_013347 [Naegleria lovaniensis]